MRYSMVCLMLCLACPEITSARVEATSETHQRLQRLLEQFPEADENGDGILTAREARRYRAMLRTLDERLEMSMADTKPDFENISYGRHPRQVMDLWLAVTTNRAPLVIYVHGGGFVSGNKRALRGLRLLPRLLECGVSVASINYRLLDEVPLYMILRDGARSVQFIRTQAETFGIDPERVAMIGSSAGAGIALWTAVHDDLSEEASADPVLRQSSRVAGVGAINPQVSYDPRVWRQTLGPPPGGSLDGAARYTAGIPEESEQRDRILREVSVIDHITADDPPIFLMNRYPDGDPGTESHYKHHPDHVRALADRCIAAGVPCEVALLSDGLSDRLAEGRLILFLLQHLGVPPPAELRPPADKD